VKALIACPECKHRKLIKYALFSSLIPILPLAFLIWIYLAADFFTIFMKTFIVITLSYMVIRAPMWMQYSFREHLEERRVYGAWKKGRDERPLSPTAVRALIRDGKVAPCTFHEAMPGVAECERCGRLLCTACYKRFYGVCKICVRERFGIPRTMEMNKKFSRTKFGMFFTTYICFLPTLVAGMMFVSSRPMPDETSLIIFLVLEPLSIAGLEVWMRLYRVMIGGIRRQRS
jgi:hypothetical protein